MLDPTLVPLLLDADPPAVFLLPLSLRFAEGASSGATAIDLFLVSDDEARDPPCKTVVETTEANFFAFSDGSVDSVGGSSDVKSLNDVDGRKAPRPSSAGVRPEDVFRCAV